MKILKVHIALLQNVSNLSTKNCQNFLDIEDNLSIIVITKALKLLINSNDQVRVVHSQAYSLQY